jgi:hypothetical protein
MYSKSNSDPSPNSNPSPDSNFNPNSGSRNYDGHIQGREREREIANSNPLPSVENMMSNMV